MKVDQMGKEFKTITKDINQYIKELHKEIPDVVDAFSTMAKAATADNVLDKKTKELVALALGVSSHCDACLGFHTQALARLGATRAEVAEVLGMAVYMGGGPSMMYAADALRAFDEASEK